ncbi:YihY/virulence factor BrkB family protein [bacterium]|nr:YihY/virulence factor BrkB family protein [bacterium]
MKKLKLELKEFYENFKKVLFKPEMAILPGQLAYFFVLAIVPTITLISYEAALLNLSTYVIYDFIGSAFSSDIASMLLATTSSNEKGIGFFLVVIVGYFIASNGPASIIITSNTIYGEKQEGFFRRRLKALIMTFVLVLLFIFMLIVPVFGTKIIELFKFVDLNSNVTDNVSMIITFLQGPITWLIMYFFIKILYTMAPNKKVRSKNVGYGALFTTFSWVIITYIYSYYINNLAHYSTFYGGLANIVILMFWLYLLAYAFTIGMALNYRKEEIELEKTGTINPVK